MNAIEIIKAKRVKLNIKQRELSSKLGLPLNGWQKIEAGVQNLRLEDFLKVIEILDIPITTFVDKDLIIISKEEVIQLNKYADAISEITKKLFDQNSRISNSNITTTHGDIIIGSQIRNSFNKK